jgi:hypothetical protein
MTKKELIKLLENVPDDAELFINADFIGDTVYRYNNDEIEEAMFARCKDRRNEEYCRFYEDDEPEDLVNLDMSRVYKGYLL